MGGVANYDEPQWQPISKLAMLTAHGEQGVQLAEEHLETLGQARERPYVLDNATVAEVLRTFGKTRADLVELYVEQGRRWQVLDLGATQRRDVERYVALVAWELALAEELRFGTIERTLAKSDLVLGMEVLGIKLA